MDKQNEVSFKSGKVSTYILEATSDLADNISQCAEIVAYRRAEKALLNDQQATKLLNDLSQLQQKIREEQYSGSIVPADLNTLRSLQATVSENRIIQTYLASQDTAIAFLREVNQEISKLVGVDFAALTRRSSSC